MHDPKSGTLYLEWRRGVVAYSLEELGGRIVFDYNEDGVVLGTECYLKQIGSAEAPLEVNVSF